MVGLGDGPCGLLHVLRAANLHAGEDLRLGDVGRDQLRDGQQLRLQGVDGLVLNQLGAGGGDHHRIDHDVTGLVVRKLLCDHPDQRRRGHHADLDRIGEDVCEHGVQLVGQKLRCDLKDACDAGCILGSEGRDGGHGVNAMRRHGLHVCLNSGASAGIASSD